MKDLTPANKFGNVLIMNIIQNAVRVIKTGKCIASQHRHDFVEADLGDGKYIAVDGGTDYFNKVGYTGEELWESLCLTDESPQEEINNKLLWGTRGKSGKSPIRFVLIRDLELDHLKSIKKTQKISDLRRYVIDYWINKKI